MRKAMAVLTACLFWAAGTTPFVHTARSLWRWSVRQVQRVGERAAAQSDGEETVTHLPVNLYYRFEETPMLAMQSSLLELSPGEESVVKSIVSRLVQGPDNDRTHLQGVFPMGCRVLSATVDGGTAVVTLSRDFLGRPDGAPADWEDDMSWQAEATLRRRLAVHSLVLALTDNALCQRVQLLVAEEDDAVPEQLQMVLLDDQLQDPGLILGACTRDESMLITPVSLVEMVMKDWQRMNYDEMYLFLYGRDGEMPGKTRFEQEMKEAGLVPLSFAVTGGAVSADGRKATVCVQAEMRNGEYTFSLSGGVIPLERVNDEWLMDIEVFRNLITVD